MATKDCLVQVATTVELVHLLPQCRRRVTHTKHSLTTFSVLSCPLYHREQF